MASPGSTKVRGPSRARASRGGRLGYKLRDGSRSHVHRAEVSGHAPRRRNKVDTARLVVGIEIEGEARAFPVQFIGYHHQVRDTVAGKQVMVSYCTVCRTGRVFSPVIDGRSETFRLVGMDHFNAMLTTTCVAERRTTFCRGQRGRVDLP